MWFFRALTRTIGRAGTGTLDRPRKRRKSGTVSDLTRACIIEHCGGCVGVTSEKVREMHLCAKSKSKSFCSAVHVRVPRPSLRWRSSQEPNRITFGMQITSLSLSSYFLLSSLRTHLLGVSPITAAAGLTSAKKFPI